MRKLLVVIAIIFLLGIALSGCVWEKEICNYDSVCTDDETDNCADCKNVIGRDIAEPAGEEYESPPAP